VVVADAAINPRHLRAEAWTLPGFCFFDHKIESLLEQS